MAKFDALFSLIKSLSKSEKRYFNLESQGPNKDQNYRLLFEALDEMEVYDEQLIHAKFQGKAFLDQLHVTKNYLRKMILKSLRNYYAKDSSDLKLHILLQDIEILFKKDLYELCLKSIKSAEQIATKYDNQLALLEVLGWKRRVQLLRKGALDSRDEINGLLEQEKALIQCLEHLNGYWSLTINQSRRFSSPSLSDVLHHPYLKDDRNATSHRSKVLYYHLRYTSHTVLGESGKSEQALDQLLVYLNTQEWHIKEDPSTYVTALNNKIGLLLNLKRLEEIPPLLKEIRDLPKRCDLKNKDRTTMKLWLRTYNVELEIYRDSGRFVEGLELIPKVRLFLEEYVDHIPKEYYVMFYYQFAYLQFMSGAYTQALRDINKILIQRYSGIRNDIIGYAQFLNLIIHYELGNITVLKYAVNASRRFLNKRGKVQSFEKVLLNFFSKISMKPASAHKSLFRSLQNKLFAESPLLDDNQLDYLDFKIWIQSKR